MLKGNAKSRASLGLYPPPPHPPPYRNRGAPQNGTPGKMLGTVFKYSTYGAPYLPTAASYATASAPGTAPVACA